MQLIFEYAMQIFMSRGIYGCFLFEMNLFSIFSITCCDCVAKIAIFT